MINILLTGANGFLGSHILRDLLLNYESKIYCIVRGKDESLAINRLNNSIKHYFGDKEYFDKFKEVVVINGDIGTDTFSLNVECYDELKNNIDIVINSAGLTKHYGIYDDFYNANVKTVENLIKFCKEGKNKKMYHISTMSVSGQFLCENTIKEEKVFDEKSLFIGQDIESNVYIKSKYIGEERVFNFFEESGAGTIIRVGNLTCRYEDGKRQLDVYNNAFTNRFVAFANIGYVPKHIENLSVEFSPVDLTSKAIVLAIKNNVKCKMLHIYNNNYIKLKNVLKEIKVLDGLEFMKTLKQEMVSNPNIKTYLPYIINDLNSQDGGYKTNIINNNDFSNKILQEFGFIWPQVDDTYIGYFIKTLKQEEIENV